MTLHLYSRSALPLSASQFANDIGGIQGQGHVVPILNLGISESTTQSEVFRYPPITSLTIGAEEPTIQTRKAAGADAGFVEGFRATMPEKWEVPAPTPPTGNSDPQPFSASSKSPATALPSANGLSSSVSQVNGLFSDLFPFWTLTSGAKR